jgi:hypothetical protein
MAPQLSSLRTSVLRLFITDTEAEKSVIYGSRRTKFIEGKRLTFDVGLNCTTLQVEILAGQSDITPHFVGS